MAPRGHTDESYSDAYDALRGTRNPRVLDAAHPKLSRAAQAATKGASRIPGSDVYATPKGRAFAAGGLLDVPTAEIPPAMAVVKNRVTCLMRCVAIGSVHAAVLLWGPR
jgi:hypothetical protein